MTWCCRATSPACPMARPPRRSTNLTTRKHHTRRRRGEIHGAQRVLLDERRLCDGHATHGCLLAYGFCTAIRGAEGGGKVENLPSTYSPRTMAIGREVPDQIAITDRREFECPIWASCRSATTRTPTTRCSSAPSRCRRRRLRPPEATANAGDLGAPALHHGDRRFAHYLKVMARQRLASWKPAIANAG